MEYVVSHLGVLFVGALIVAVFAVLWYLLLEKSAILKRERAEARKAEAVRRRVEEKQK